MSFRLDDFTIDCPLFSSHAPLFSLLFYYLFSEASNLLQELRRNVNKVMCGRVWAPPMHRCPTKGQRYLSLLFPRH